MPDVPRTPTGEQADAIAAAIPNLVVVASAGSGKTFVLVERYLRHIADGFRPDEILTITFTKKAAAEMKRRIVDRLRAEGNFEAAQVAETGPIQTIHSFCERLLRENALEAGMDPRFEIDSEARIARRVAACVREALASNLEDAPQAEALVAFLAGQRRYGENRSPYAKLEGAVLDVLNGLRGTAYNGLEVHNWHHGPEALRERWDDALISALPESVRRVFANIDAPTLQERLAQAWKEAVGRTPVHFRGRYDEEAEREAILHTCGLVQLACAAWWRLDRDMDAEQALDFTALEERAVRLLERSEVTRDRLRAQYRVVMVDESQDVNPMQYRLLDALGTDQVMFVGDDQQSIYGFRQADVELFRRRASHLGTLPLSRNFRSGEGIQNFVDTVFGAMWGEDYRPMNAAEGPMDFEELSPKTYEGVEIWRHSHEGRGEDLDGTAHYIRELWEEGTPLRDIAVLVRDGPFAVRMKTALEGVGLEARIAGGSERFYTRLEVRDLANALRAVANPYDDFSLLACLRSPVVGLSLDAIVLLGTASPVIERLEELVLPISEDQARLAKFLSWYRTLSKFADRLPAWEVLAELFTKSDYLNALGRRRNAGQLLANVRKLLTLATQEPELGPVEYAERIREIQDLRHREGDAPATEEDADAITIMTIHKAKGLEFDTVVLPQTKRTLKPRSRDVAVDSRLGLVATKFGKNACLVHKWIEAMAKERGIEEELRVLYVALTRAKSRLCVCLYRTKDDSFSRRLESAIGSGGLPGARVRQTQDLTAETITL